MWVLVVLVILLIIVIAIVGAFLIYKKFEHINANQKEIDKLRKTINRNKLIISAFDTIYRK